MSGWYIETLERLRADPSEKEQLLNEKLGKPGCLVKLKRAKFLWTYQEELFHPAIFNIKRKEKIKTTASLLKPKRIIVEKAPTNYKINSFSNNQVNKNFPENTILMFLGWKYNHYSKANEFIWLYGENKYYGLIDVNHIEVLTNNQK